MKRLHLMVYLTLLVLIGGAAAAWVYTDKTGATCTTDSECGCTDDCLE